MAGILLIDDDQSNAEVLQTVLEHQKYQVRSIPKAALMQNVIRRFNSDLIVMDILLDTGDGRIYSNVQKRPAISQSYLSPLCSNRRHGPSPVGQMR